MSTWYLGPDGDMRALSCPQPNMDLNTVRFGGVHQGLSGARTMDVTGFRSEYRFQWILQDRDEWRWLEGLHTRLIPGPFRLIDPMRTNRLSLAGSKLEGAWRTGRGLWVPSANWAYDWDWPAGLPLTGRSVRWFNRGADPAEALIDYTKAVPVFPLETITASIYMKATAPITASLWLDWYHRTDPVSVRATSPKNVTTAWQRFTITVPAPAGASSAVFGALIVGQTVPEVLLAAPQFEGGIGATEWDLGGGSALVHVDQLTTSSPRFPLTDCELTLLEA